MTNKNNTYPSLNQRIPTKKRKSKYYAVRNDGTSFPLGESEEKTYINSQKEIIQTNQTSTKTLKKYDYFTEEDKPMLDKHVPDNFTSNARHIMNLPIFSVESKRIKDNIIEHSFIEKGIKYHLKVINNDKLGIADQRDGDIVRYALTYIMYNYKNYGKLTDNVQFSQYELLKEIKGNVTKHDYEWLQDAIFRLTSTIYVTNLWEENPLETYSGNLVNISFSNHPTLKKRQIKLKFNRKPLEFLINAGILSIDRQILKESSNLRKKLLELVQSHMGKDNVWQIKVKKLSDKCGYKGSIKAFNKNLKRLDLPYQIERKSNLQKEQIIHFSKVENK